MSETQTTIVAGDIQYPFHDSKAWGVFLEFVKWMKPDSVILHGDVVDFYAISDFDKDPERTKKLATEIEGLREEVLLPLSKAAGKANKFVIPGNHEDRLRRYIWKKAPELDGLVSELSDIFCCNELKYIMVPKKRISCGSLEVMHGSFLSQHSGQTAMKHLNRYGTSVLVGHSHRLGAFYKTDMRGPHGAWECGCLCDLNPEYEDFPNWQQGFAVVTVWPSRLFNVQLVPIINRDTIVFGGKEFGG